MNNTIKTLIICTLIVLPFACGNVINSNDSNTSAIPEKKDLPDPEFSKYWFDGKAELASYKLTQARYGELREGSAVLVFVTEPFSVSKRVKLDNPDATPGDRQDVLKLNFTRNFKTGIYPYSLLTSVFSPVNGDKSLKINNSCQEWCGHTYAQLSQTGSGYNWLLHSYFESENEESFAIPAGTAEDQLWNTIRIDPNSLPEGEIELIPALHFLRFKHLEAKAYKATCRRKTSGNESVYTIDYQDIERSLEIRFANSFPYQVLAWTEVYPDGWGENPPVLTTRGVLQKSIRTDYWSKNSNADSLLRKELGLD